MKCRITLRLALILALLAICPSNSRASEADPYSMEQVRVAIRNFRAGFRVSFSIKGWGLLNLGDRAAIAIMKDLSEEEFEDPKTVDACLWVIQEAFSYPDTINLAEDKKPGATMFFLRSLELTSKDPAVVQRVRELRKYIAGQLGSTKSE